MNRLMLILAQNETEPTPGMQGLWEKVPEPLRPWIAPAALTLAALLVLRMFWSAVARWLRSRRPAAINPKLAKYNIDHAELDRQRRERAGQIVATSTSARLAGFRLVRQVEAVFVEGYRSPEDALIALKASAAERGANGILNVGTERTAAGRCSASGDAVVIEPLASGLPMAARNPKQPPPPGI